jgi:hypothetical protein
MISNTVMLLNQNGFSLRRTLADIFIVAKRIRRSLNWNSICSMSSLDRSDSID